MTRRIHSIVLLFALLIGAAGMNYVQATVYNGGCGAVGNEVNVTWAVNTETGVLSISGTGGMADYDGFNNKKAPWDGWYKYITSIVVYNGVTRIGNWSFYYLINATSVSLPNSVTEIGDYCFRQCTFTTITLPNKLKKIGTYAFYSCGGLTSITIPSTVTGLSTGVFYGCTNLKDIYLPWTTSASIPAYPTSFVSDKSKVTLHVACGSGSIYRAASGWKDFTIIGPSKYKLTVTSANSAQGTVKIGNGTAGASVSQSNTYCETPIQITAVPVAHYHFSKWNDNNTANPRTIYMPGENTTYTASFAIDQHTLTVISSNTNYGTVSGGGTYNYNTKVTITATPKTGYHFSKWSDNNTNASRQVTVTGNATYSASFATNQYTLTVNSNNTNYGTVSGGGIYNYNTKATLTATPKTGYHFVKWNDNNTNASRQITVTANATYTANFAITNYTITAKTNNSGLGTVSGGGTYQEGKTATLTATPANCTSAFVQWNDGNTDNPRSFTVTENKTLTAQFASLTGNCGANGNNLTWSFNRCTGVLTISGSGAMADWSAATDVPWYNYRKNITSVVLPYGLTNIGDYAFYETAITKVDIPAAVRTLGAYSFCYSSLDEICLPEGLTSIGNCAFLYSHLRRVYLPTTLTSIGNYAALKYTSYNYPTLTIPSSVTSLGAIEARGYPSRDLYVSWKTNIPNRTGRVAGIPSPRTKLHVPYGTSALYRAQNDNIAWSRLYEIVEDVDERAIDLGLSIRWASCNIGATAPEENGEYYMWADTLGGWDSYVRANYPYYKNNQYTRYNATDHRTRLIPFDDVAYIRWGETWRMPTKDEWHELFTQCIWEKEKLNDKWVYKVTGPNGNYIYIPLPGYIEGTFHSPEADGYYWTSELYSTGSPISTFISSGGTRNSGPADPSYGRSVRAVYRREWPSFTLTITDTPDGTTYTKAVNAGSSYILTAQEDDCHHFVQWSDGNTSNPRTVSVTADAVYTAEYEYVPLASGTCGAEGDNLTWTLSCDGVLTITGTGAMAGWENIADIPWYSYQESITSVIIEEGVTNIGKGAFYKISSLVSATIPSSVTSIDYCAFYECTSLVSVTIQEGLISFGASAFNGCSALTSAPIPNSVTSIGNSAFKNCSSLSSLTIPNGVETIGNSAFESCSGLTSVTIPNNVTRINEQAFRYCSSLTEVTIPGSVTRLSSFAFANCSALTSVVISEGVEIIDMAAFQNCSHLTTVTFPSSVTGIYVHSFTFCSAITDIYVSWTENIPYWNNITNRSPQSDITLHIPCGTEELYNAADGWKDYTIEGEGGPYTVTVQAEDPTMGDVSIIVN